MDIKIQQDNPIIQAKDDLKKRVVKAKDAVKESQKTGFLSRLKEVFARFFRNKNPNIPKSSAPTYSSTVAGTPKSPDSTRKILIKGKSIDDVKVDVDIKMLADKDEKKLSDEEKKILIEDEKLFQEGTATIKDIISPTSMDISSTKLRIGDVFVRSFYVYSYPRFLDTNWLAPLINFDVSMDISMFVYPFESVSIMKKLRRKVAQFRSSIRMDRERGVVEDPALETALEDAEALRRDLQRGTERFFQFGLYFTIYADDENKLNQISKQLESLLGGKLVLTKRADMQMDHAFSASLPLCLDEIQVFNNMNTGPLSTTFPFTSSELTSNRGILYGLNRHNDSLIIFDRFELENANSVVFAKSGAGKSYSVKLEILRSLMMGTDVLIIDPENEYKELCQEVGGTYINVSLSSDQRLNPFDLPKSVKDVVEKTGDRLREHIINLTGLVKLMLGKITDEESGLLDQALIQTYASKGITMDTREPERMIPPLMEDLVDILGGTKGAENMSNRLGKFVTGTFSGLFNLPTNVNLGAGVIVFSIRDLEDELRPLASYVILNFIWNEVRSQLKRRLLVIDEAWIMMQHEDSARFLYGLAKRARKYYLGVTTITQDVEDFVTSPYGKAIITNSSIQLLLKQSSAAMEHLQKIFNLTDGEKYLLLNSGVGQGLFFAGNKHVAIQIIASYGEDRIVTTNPEELLKARMTDINIAEPKPTDTKSEDYSDTSSEDAQATKLEEAHVSRDAPPAEGSDKDLGLEGVKKL